jgi:hypothetical protein
MTNSAVIRHFERPAAFPETRVLQEQLGGIT